MADTQLMNRWINNKIYTTHVKIFQIYLFYYPSIQLCVYLYICIDMHSIYPLIAKLNVRLYAYSVLYHVSCTAPGAPAFRCNS